MKINLHVRSRICAVLGCLAVFAMSTLAAPVANGKGSSDPKVTSTSPMNKRVNSRGKATDAKATSVKSRVSRLGAKKLNRETAKRLLEECGCSLTVDEAAGGSWWRCFKGCLADAGVGYYGMILCGTSCAAAATGAGALICAVCTGLTVAVVETCALGCAAYPDGYKGTGKHSIILGKNLKPKPTRQGSSAQRIKV